MSHMLFVIGSSSELLGLSSSPELLFSVLFRSFGVVLVNFPVGRFTRTTFSISLWWRVNACVSMFFCVLRAAKGEHGEVGKLVWVKWLCATYLCRQGYSFFNASAGLVRIRRMAWRITVAMVTSRTIMRAVR